MYLSVAHHYQLDERIPSFTHIVVFRVEQTFLVEVPISPVILVGLIKLYPFHRNQRTYKGFGDRICREKQHQHTQIEANLLSN